ncbi:hypothetical protein XI09_04445 [Bradyrhizobium sp. CCBAU 11386]|nr:hypothetical protein [Bradyrhizobium sp. CCBAU 11386]MDA9504027.1 hypothetical protein [Bradyrhizobium sp. CCBAU 11386]
MLLGRPDIVRGVLIYCADYRCGHSIARTAGLVTCGLSDIEPRFICTACGERGADVRPDFNRDGLPTPAMGYR